MNTCDQCGKENASIQYTEVAEGQISKLHLCHSCAESQGLLGDQEEEDNSVDALISRISQSHIGEVSSNSPQADICESCKLQWTEFEARGVLGCEECYQAFASRLVSLMRHTQGEKLFDYRSRKGSNAKALLPELRALLEQAIRDEDYEKAARLRDRIQRAELQQGSPPAAHDPQAGE